jgi:hypothetical protein
VLFTNVFVVVAAVRSMKSAAVAAPVAAAAIIASTPEPELE